MNKISKLNIYIYIGNSDDHNIRKKDRLEKRKIKFCHSTILSVTIIYNIYMMVLNPRK